MSLTLVAIPIGNPQDITLAAIDTLKEAELIIGEDRRQASTFLKKIGITDKQIELLNEHSKKQDVEELAALCKKHKVALITDCGTPGFSDPGADLVNACRKQNIKISTRPGASSLMALLSLASRPITQFVFRGFLPKDNTEREIELKKLQKENRAIVLMDTPYRLQKCLQELILFFPSRKVLLTLDLTADQETLLEGTPAQVQKQLQVDKAEFMVLIYDSATH